MVTIGDVIAVIGVLIGICLSSWAVLMGFTTLFPRRADAACEAVRRHPWRATLLGLAVWTVLGSIGLAMLGSPLPVVKLTGLVWLMILTALTVIGASGLTTLIARRLQGMGAGSGEFGALSRSALILVVSPILPFVGWFAVLPVLLAASLGAGIAAVFARLPQPAVAEPGFDVGA